MPQCGFDDVEGADVAYLACSPGRTISSPIESGSCVCTGDWVLSSAILSVIVQCPRNPTALQNVGAKECNRIDCTSVSACGKSTDCWI